jgi:hypothetical protein
LSVRAVFVLQTGNTLAAPHVAVWRTVTAIAVVDALHADPALDTANGLFGTGAILVASAASDAYISLRVTDSCIASAVLVRHALYADAALRIASGLLATGAVLVVPAASEAYILLRVTDFFIASAVLVRHALYATSVEAELPPLVTVLGDYALYAAVRHRVAFGVVAMGRGETGHALAQLGFTVGFVCGAVIVSGAATSRCYPGPREQIDTAIVATIASRGAARYHRKSDG